MRVVDAVAGIDVDFEDVDVFVQERAGGGVDAQHPAVVGCYPVNAERGLDIEAGLGLDGAHIAEPRYHCLLGFVHHIEGGVQR